MRRQIAIGSWLVLAWSALWADITVANLVGGVLAAAAVLAAFPVADRPSPRPSAVLQVRPVAALGFLAYFVVKLVEANVIVAWEVVTPWSRINEAIVRVPLQSDSRMLTTLVANAVTLTPGTLTLEARRDEEGHTLFIHVLHLRSVEKVRQGVRVLEYLAVQAFGDAHARGHVVDPRNLPAVVEEA